ncbi:MAG: P-aminobenzoate N-oxygenase AurF, partial [Bdellovibrionia bacterium]
MNRQLYNPQRKSLMDDDKTYKKILLNHKRNKEQDNTELLDEAAAAFRYQDCKDEMWNPESFSLMYKTPLWEQSSESQRIKLNQLYWIAYY